MKVLQGEVVAFAFLCVYLTSVVESVQLGENAQKTLTSILHEFDSQPGHPRYDSVIQFSIATNFPKIFIWCPKKHFDIEVLCPLHKVGVVFHCWTSNGKEESFRQPRLVYDLYGNIMLVQAIYRCPYNRHEYHSASTEILEILPPEIAGQFPFKLFYRSACSQNLLDYLIVHIGRGHNFLELAELIANINFRGFYRMQNSFPLDENEYYESTIYSSPSSDQLMYMFLAYFNGVRSTFENEIAMTPCSILSCDHTFKVSKHIGVVRTTDNKFVKQFQNLFIGLNENGQVVLWRFTKTTAFEQIEDLLVDFKCKLDATSSALNMIIVDDCCSVSPSYQRIFPGVPIKLDIFHACQRFAKTIPKACSWRKKLTSDFGLIFRQNGDTGDERTLNTAKVEGIESNLEMFLQKWENQLSKLTLDSIANLRMHIKKGCCSDIPPGTGTQKNERLHKELKRSLLGGASVISPELAIAVLSCVLYIWSCKRNPSARKHVSNARVTPVVPVELKQQHLLARSDFQNVGVAPKFKSSGIPAEVPLVMRKCKEFNDRQSSEMEFSSNNLDSDVPNADVDNIIHLKNENIINYVLSRGLHLNDVFTSIESKCTSRDFDILDFPFTDMERIVRVLHSVSTRDDVSLGVDMNKDCLEKNLLSFNLQCDAVVGDGNCCFASIATVLNRLVLERGNGGNRLVHHLQSLGLSKGISSDTTRLRQLFCQEIREKKEKYMSWIECDIEQEIEKFSKEGWFNSSLGDLCAIACSNILKTTIVVVTSMTRVPYIPFVPDEILTDDVLYIAFNHSYVGHYDATKDIMGEFESNEESTCNCGVMARSKQKIVTKSCDPEANMSLCSCVKNEKKCSRKCRCINCINSPVLKKTVADGNAKGCTCGGGKKGVVSCQDGTSRKSKCPCLKRSMYCSNRCKCLSCGNKCDEGINVDVSESAKTASSVKRKRSHPETYKRTKGVDYLANDGFDISEGPWTKLETFTLFIVLEVIKCAGLSLIPNNVIELYNFIALSKDVMDMKLPISYKSTKRILGKLTYINSKHSVFQTFMDETIDHF